MADNERAFSSAGFSLDNVELDLSKKHSESNIEFVDF